MRRFLLPVVCALLLAGACTTKGTPTPQAHSGPVRTTASSSEPAAARPRALDLDGGKPCDLLTGGQLGELKIDRPGHETRVPALNATGCTWTVTGASSVLVPVLHEGIGVWTAGDRIGKGEVVAPVSGFPAVTVNIDGNPERCDLMVDTADAQYLAVAFSVSPSFQDRFPSPCDGARQLAEAAMQNLLK